MPTQPDPRAAPASPGRWAGVPAGERRSERRRLLLQAAFELFGSGGEPAASLRAVCRRADLHPRYFKESFPDRDAMLVALYDQQAELLAVEVAQALRAAGADLAAATRAGIETVFRFVAADPRRAKVLYTEAPGSEALARRRQATMEALIAAISGGVPLGEDAPPALDRVAAAMFTGGVNELLMSWLAGRLEQSLDELVDDAVTLSLAVFEAAAARGGAAPTR